MHSMSIIKQSVKMSLQNIKSNKMRTFLTTLGIIIGVAAVIAMITIVNGVIDTVMGQFSSLGAGTLSVTINGSALKSGLTETDLQNLSELDNVAGISPSVTIRTSAARGTDFLDNVSVEGKNDYYFQKEDLISYGHGLTRSDVENESYVCIIDQDLADNLFLGENPIGQQVIVNGIRYTVVGLEGTDDSLMSAMAIMGASTDGTIIIPYTNAMKMAGSSSITSLEIYIADTDRTDELTSDVEAVLYKAFNENEDCYSTFSMDSLLDTMNKMMSTMTYMLAGIASIALLVGGIGIMNMMLVSVSERTKEIGLRKAMGATPGRIQLQFLLEAIVLSLMGGIIGVILGLIISFVGAQLLNTNFTISMSAIALGVGFSAAVGIIFGWAPARKASALNPIDALRSE